MKCKVCNGTGYVTACVYESDEIGFVDKNYECAVCHGTGQIEQTNEEWFCSLSTEEKAEFLSDVNVNEDFCWFCETKFRDCKPKECKYKNGCAEAWKKWLKEIHDEM